MRRSKFTSEDYRLLVMIQEKPRLSYKELSQGVVAQSERNIYRRVDRLITAGFITKQREILPKGVAFISANPTLRQKLSEVNSDSLPEFTLTSTYNINIYYT